MKTQSAPIIRERTVATKIIIGPHPEGQSQFSTFPVITHLTCEFGPVSSFTDTEWLTRCLKVTQLVSELGLEPSQKPPP